MDKVLHTLIKESRLIDTDHESGKVNLGLSERYIIHESNHLRGLESLKYRPPANSSADQI